MEEDITRKDYQIQELDQQIANLKEGSSQVTSEYVTKIYRLEQ